MKLMKSGLHFQTLRLNTEEGSIDSPIQNFLNRYKKILKPSAIIHLKTDSEFLHGYTLGILQGYGHEILTAHHDIYGAPEYEPDTLYLREIKTYYEELFSAKGKTITYIKFRLNQK